VEHVISGAPSGPLQLMENATPVSEEQVVLMPSANPWLQLEAEKSPVRGEETRLDCCEDHLTYRDNQPLKETVESQVLQTVAMREPIEKLESKTSAPPEARIAPMEQSNLKATDEQFNLLAVSDKQRLLVERAFAHDNVVKEFEEEKKKVSIIKL
jgi:U3 small nucleolar RNA-associated protein 14